MKHLSRAAAIVSLCALFSLVSLPALADSFRLTAVDPTEEITKGGRGRDVSWGDKTDQNPLTEIVPPAGRAQGRLVFNWTKDGAEHKSYLPYDLTNATDKPIEVRLFRPKDATITDWKQTVTNGDGTSVVTAGDLKRGSPWSFQPLDDIADAFYRIPDLAPTQGGGTIFAAVNFDLYLQNNPFGFLGGHWTIGQTLADLGIDITNGEIPGLEGILWATSDFVFDASSAIGWTPSGGAGTLLNSADFQAANGDIVILAAHETSPIPEPSAIALVATGGLAVIRAAARRRQKATSPSPVDQDV